MSQLSPALEAALRGDCVTVFGAIAIDLPDYRLSLLDGAGTVNFGDRTYVGEDATFGVLADIENLTDGGGDSAPTIAIGLLPNGGASAAALAAPTMQGAPLVITLGAVNDLTGQVIGTSTIFVGEVDVPRLESSATSRRLEYEVVSIFERLFEEDESARLSAGFHRSIFANEAGLDFVTGVDAPVPWGIAGSAVVTTFTGGTSSGEYYS